MSIGSNSNRAARWAALFCFAGLGAAAWFALRPPVQAPGPAIALDVLTIETKAGPKSFKIEVANTPEQQALGLMFRTKLDDTEGMLFPHDDTREVSMWMRNTYIPLDMVFIRADGVIHRIEVRTEPLSERVIEAGGEVSAVLELAGGAAERLGIKQGDTVHYPIFDTVKTP